MLVTERCVKCLYGRQEAVSKDEDYLSEIRQILNNRGEMDSAPYMVYLFNQVYEKKYGKKYSFEKEKKECNDFVLSMQEKLRKELRRADDPLERALCFARIGNYMDYGALKEVDTDAFLKLLSDASWSSRDHEVYQSFLEECGRAEHFLLIADNCGEIVLDKLLLEILKERFPKLEITVMVRGGKVLNDVTAEDAEYVGLHETADIITNGKPLSGTVYHLLSDEAKEVFERADVILSKGQGNFESLSRQGHHVFYMFLCKCDLFTERFQVPRFTGLFLEEGILSIHVKVDECFDVCGNDVTVNLVNFHGTAESEFFTGRILAGGVDTQIYKKEEPGRLSARYMLEGTDSTGESCRIFIENNGVNEDGIIVTNPRIITDSKVLSWMMSSEMEGRVLSGEDGLVIKLYQKKRRQQI